MGPQKISQIHNPATALQSIQLVVSAISDQVTAAMRYYDDHSDSDGLLCQGTLRIAEIKEFIRHLWMIEKTDKGQYFVRLYSSGTVDITGIDMTGQEILPTERYAKWFPFYDQVLESRKPMLVRNDLEEDDKSFLTAEVAILPMKDKQGCPRFVLCPYAIINFISGQSDI